MPRLLAFPAWRDNPYLNLLYLATRGAGWDVQGTTSLDEVLERVPSFSRGDVVHVHWTQPVCQNAADEAAAAQRVKDFVGVLTKARGRGVHVLWTVHNTLPHELRFRELEVELCERIAALATRVLQINSHTLEAAADEYALPAEKVVTLPHASYVGVYPAWITREEARARLRVPATSPTVGFVGQIRPYKGITTLLEATGRLAQEVDDVTLLLAGKTREDVMPDIQAALPSTVRAVRHHDFVEETDLQVWFRAADVMVFPYERVLNSGSLFLSATMGRPCILPSEPHLVAEFADEPWVSFYEAGEGAPERLARAIREALATAQLTSPAAEAFARRYTPYGMSRDFRALLEGLGTAA